VATAAGGFVALVVGFMMPKGKERANARQTLYAGSHSTNLQAGHNIRIGERSGNNGDAS